MTAGSNRGRSLHDDRHFDQVYRRIDDLSARVGKLERSLWVGTGILSTVATFNLISNLSQLGG